MDSGKPSPRTSDFSFLRRGQSGCYPFPPEVSVISKTYRLGMRECIQHRIIPALLIFSVRTLAARVPTTRRFRGAFGAMLMHHAAVRFVGLADCPRRLRSDDRYRGISF